MAKLWPVIVVVLAASALARAEDEDLAGTFSRMQSRAAQEQSALAARRAEIARLEADLLRTRGVFSSDARCKLIHYRPASNAERARLLVNDVAAHIIRANHLSIPGFCGVVLWPGEDLDAGSMLLQKGAFPVTADNAQEAGAEAAAPKAIRIVVGSFRKLPDDSALAAVLGHELAHLALGHGVARQMNDEALNGVAQDFNGSDFDKALFLHLERRKLGFSQAAEVEADRLGRVYIARAGYDPEGMARMISLLDDPESEKK